jgi:hypothetical protein
MQGVRVLVSPLMKPQPAGSWPAMATTRAARDPLNFAALSGRFIQNLRRYVGDDVQFKKGTAHVHHE